MNALAPILALALAAPDGPSYTDPVMHFSLTPPAGWKQTSPEELKELPGWPRKRPGDDAGAGEDGTIVGAITPGTNPVVR
jgi:hypothetical protein